MNRDEILKLEAGREMDTAVAIWVMKWQYNAELGGRETWVNERGLYERGICYDGYEDEEDFHILHWHPSESILCAWEVVEKMAERGIQLVCGVGFCDVYIDRDQKEGINAETPLAICRAALLACASD